MVDVTTIIVLPSLCQPQINEDGVFMALYSGKSLAYCPTHFQKFNDHASLSAPVGVVLQMYVNLVSTDYDFGFADHHCFDFNCHEAHRKKSYYSQY